MQRNSTIEKHYDNIYLNATFTHDASFGERPSPAIYNVTKTLPIVDIASDYYVSIIRFDIPLGTVPLYIFPVIPGSLATQTSPMIIGVTVGGVDFPVNLVYVADFTTSLFPPVNQNNPNQQIITPFYFVYAYQNLIDAINKALNTAWVAAGSPGGAPGPYFYLDSVTELISLVVSNAFIVAGATIFVNEFLVNYLDAFHWFQNGINVPNGHDFTFIFDSTLNFTLPPFTVGPTLWKFTQEYTTLVYWSALRRILITSNNIPVINEFLPVNSIDQGIASSLPVLTDFVPSIEQPGQQRSIAYYYPTSQYRLVDMISNRPIQAVDLRIFWQDKQNNIYPLLLQVLQTASVKMIFVKKDLYHPMSELLK